MEHDLRNSKNTVPHAEADNFGRLLFDLLALADKENLERLRKGFTAEVDFYLAHEGHVAEGINSFHGLAEDFVSSKNRVPLSAAGHFGRRIFDLIFKADVINRGRIGIGYPEHVAFYEVWMNTAKEPRDEELHAMESRAKLLAKKASAFWN